MTKRTILKRLNKLLKEVDLLKSAKPESAKYNAWCTSCRHYAQYTSDPTLFSSLEHSLSNSTGIYHTGYVSPEDVRKEEKQKYIDYQERLTKAHSILQLIIEEIKENGVSSLNVPVSQRPSKLLFVWFLVSIFMMFIILYNPLKLSFVNGSKPIFDIYISAVVSFVLSLIILLSINKSLWRWISSSGTMVIITVGKMVYEYMKARH